MSFRTDAVPPNVVFTLELRCFGGGGGGVSGVVGSDSGFSCSGLVEGVWFRAGEGNGGMRRNWAATRECPHLSFS